MKFKGKIIEEMNYKEVIDAIKEVTDLLKESDDRNLDGILMRLIERRDQFRSSCDPFLLKNRDLKE